MLGCPNWVGMDTASSTQTQTLTNDDAWVCWNEAYVSAATSNIWTAWNVQYQQQQQATQVVINQAATAISGLGLGGASSQNQYGVYAQQAGLGNRRAAIEGQIAATRERALAYEAKRVECVERATLLLCENLTPAQAEEFRRTRAFTVHSKDGGRVYLVTYGTAGNVFELKAGKRQTKFCIHPDEDVPVPDVMLAQKLMIETDEAAFRRVANKTAVAA